MITKPTFIVNSAICKRNIKTMAEKAKKHHLEFRPHFKTHQSIKIGNLFKAFGITKITVSSLTMAEYFAKVGWKDITVAFPLNLLEIDTIIKLSKKINLNLVVESLEVTLKLATIIESKINLFIKIDTGYGRTGISSGNLNYISKLVNLINETDNLLFAGFLVHSGHTYHVKGKSFVEQIHSDSLTKLNQLKNKFKHTNPNLIISIGDTPSCSISNNFTGIDEIRPGNFIFYDAMQLEIGSCQLKNIASVVACPVVSKHSERNEMVIYGGGVHLSKETTNSGNYGPHYGLIAVDINNTWLKPIDNTYVSKLSQEHGTIKCSNEFFQNTNVGDLVYIIPVHSCLVANLLKEDLLII